LSILPVILLVDKKNELPELIKKQLFTVGASTNNFTGKSDKLVIRAYCKLLVKNEPAPKVDPKLKIVVWDPVGQFSILLSILFIPGIV
jgi:hypothetical protein